MWFFEDIFTNASDRARIFAICLSALLVFLGVWYTQWQTKKREKNALLREKHEEIVRTLIALESKHKKLENITIARLRSENTTSEKTSKKYGELYLSATEDVERLTLLIPIYAPYLADEYELNGLESVLHSHTQYLQRAEDSVELDVRISKEQEEQRILFKKMRTSAIEHARKI